MRVIIKSLLSTDKRKHYKYCPCCRYYEPGVEPTANQMGEFLEFIRQQHEKTNGKPKNLLKRMRPADQNLDFDSVSDITDLSNEDILSQSLHLLSTTERQRLKRYNSQFRAVLNSSAPKHDCYASKKGRRRREIEKKRYVKMELRTKSEPKQFSEKSNSAHQFSVRDKSQQCDSEERKENEM